MRVKSSESTWQFVRGMLKWRNIEGTFTLIRGRELLESKDGFLSVRVLCLVESHEFKQDLSRLFCPFKGWDFLVAILALKPSVDLYNPKRSVNSRVL